MSHITIRNNWEKLGIDQELTFYDGSRDFMLNKDREVIIAGPYDCSKTFTAMHKYNLLLWTYPNARMLLVRKSYKALLPSALATFYNKVLPVPPSDERCPIEVYGGGKPERIIYPNGSEMWLGGMDVPEKVLSSEWDYIFVPQAEELSLHDWEQLGGRCSGRAGNVPWPQIGGDANPDKPTHWIPNREVTTFIHAKHTDNPTIYLRDENHELVLDAAGNPVPTSSGRVRMETLRAMTGLRRKRGYLGLWVGAEGQVYEDFDPSVHVIDPFEIPYDWPRYRVIDFGYTHPFVCHWYAEDEDGRLYMYRELYMSKRTVRQHVQGDESHRGILELSEGEKYVATICDWNAEDRATLEEYGISTINADKRIQVGIEKVQDRLRVQDDGRPRVMFFRNSLVEVDETLRDRYEPTTVLEEFPAYVWRNSQSGKEQGAKDEVPIRAADHGMDTLKYMILYKDGMLTRATRVIRYA